MKTIAFTRCHYGADYLEYVIRSTAGFADQHIVIYSPTVTRGYNPTGLTVPDSRQDLMRLAQKAGPRLMWIDGEIPVTQELIDRFPDADLMLELDADEVIHPDLFEDIKRRYAAGQLTAGQYRLPFVHHWRSFRYVCKDTNWPVRLYVPKNRSGQIDYWPDGPAHGNIHHFGYARTIEDMRYKLDVSMHKPEFRREWWADTFLAFPERLTDLHPVCTDGFWNAEIIDPADLPPLMREHRWFNWEKIE